MRIRRAQPDDLDALVRLGERYAVADGHVIDPDQVRAAMRPLLDDDPRGLILVAERDEDLHGYAVLTWGYGIESGGVEALLDEIYVEPSGQGIGTALLDAVLEAARGHGARTIFLETESANDAARAFYVARGFAVEDSVWLRRAISD